jgi:hypothetical protein
MTPESFANGIYRLETFCKSKLHPEVRSEYLRALSVLDDNQWARVVEHAFRAWKHPGVPRPANLLEWAGVVPESPAEAAGSVGSDGREAELEGRPLREALREIDRTGAGPLPLGWWGGIVQKTCYENAAVMLDPPPPKLEGKQVLSWSHIVNTLERISQEAQRQIAEINAPAVPRERDEEVRL